MPFSLHSHSGQFCKHARDKLEDMVLTAIHKGFRVYGLTEHMPRYDQAHFYPEEQDMNVSDLIQQFDLFVEEAVRLRDVYRSQITLLIGFETEWIDPTYADAVQKLRQRHASSLDYCVGSVHHVRGIPIDFSLDLFEKAERVCNGSASLLLDYFRAVRDLIEQLRPDVVGHFDLIRMYRPELELTPEVWLEVEACVRTVNAYGGLFEVNARGFKKMGDRAYPMPDLLKYLHASGARLTLSDDSHSTSDVGLHYDRWVPYFRHVFDDNLPPILYYLDRQNEGEREGAEAVGGRKKGLQVCSLEHWEEDVFFCRMLK